MAESVGSIFVKVGAETGSFDRAMAGVQGRMSSVGDRLATVGRAMTVGVTLPIVAGAALAVKAFANFEQALNSFQAVTGATGKQMNEVSDLAKKLGNDIKLPGTSAKDAAEAMTELAKGGMDVDQSMKAARATLQLAAAAEIENAEAATIVADALNAFHLKAKDATKVTDLLAAAANASTGGITDMSDSLKMVSAVAASAGIPIDDMVTAIAEMANAGIKGSDAGTSLKTMLLSLQAPTEKAKNLMKDLGINVYDAQGQMLPMRDLIQEFTGALGGLTQQQRNAAAINAQYPRDEERLRAVGYGRPLADLALECGGSRVAMYFDGSIQSDTVAIHPVPIPPSFTRGRSARRISVALAFDPPVRRQRREYLAGEMSFDLLRNVTPEQIAERYERQGEDRVDLWTDRRRLDLKPGSTRTANSTLQVRRVFRRQMDRDDGDVYYLAVKHRPAPWASGGQQSYAVVVEIVDEERQDIDLYAEVLQRVALPARVRVRS